MRQHVDHGLRLDGPRERLPRRRRQHDGRRDRKPGQGPELRVHPGGRAQGGRLRGRVHRRPGRHPERRHQVRRQRVPRRRLRILRQRRPPGARTSTCASRARGRSRTATFSRRPRASPSASRSRTTALDIGGFMLKDTLWFFGAYDHVENTLPASGDDGPGDRGTVTDLDTTSNLYSGKLTWNFDQGHEHADRHASSAIRPTTPAPSARSSVRRRPTTGR